MDREHTASLLNPPGAPQDGRLHDVSIDGGPELPELEPGIELGGATVLRASDARMPALQASTVGPVLPVAPVAELPPDPAAEGLAADDSDRIQPGLRGSHLGGTTSRI